MIRMYDGPKYADKVPRNLLESSARLRGAGARLHLQMLCPDLAFKHHEATHTSQTLSSTKMHCLSIEAMDEDAEVAFALKA